MAKKRPAFPFGKRWIGDFLPSLEKLGDQLHQHPPMSLPADWERHFEPAIIEAGRKLQRSGNVLHWQPDEERGGMAAEVQGSEPEPYDVSVIWGEDEPEEEYFESDCSCPTVSNCEHGAAAIFAASGGFAPSGVVPPKSKPSQPVLPAQLRQWLDQLGQATAPPPPSPVETGDEPERLAYVLNWEKPGYGAAPSVKPQLFVSLQVVRKLLKGGYGQGRNYYFENVLNGYRNDPLVRPTDLAILRRLKLIQPPGIYSGANLLTGTEGASLLEEMLRTGRCHWRGTGKKHPALTLAPLRFAQLEWKMNETGMQSPAFGVTPSAACILPLTPPWYLDEAASACGPLDTGLPPRRSPPRGSMHPRFCPTRRNCSPRKWSGATPS